MKNQTPRTPPNPPAPDTTPRDPHATHSTPQPDHPRPHPHTRPPGARCPQPTPAHSRENGGVPAAVPVIELVREELLEPHGVRMVTLPSRPHIRPRCTLAATTDLGTPM